MSSDEPTGVGAQSDETPVMEIPDVADRLRRCQQGLVEAVRARDAEAAAHESTRAELAREVARRERLEVRLERTEERAERLQGLVDAIRSSKGWRLIESYRSLVTRLRS